MTDCLFCKIIDKEVPSDTIYQDDFITIFKDINPAAPVHLLIIPNQHIASVNDVGDSDENLMGKLITGAKMAAEISSVDESGYRLILNSGPDAHQVIFHMHLHLLGGASMQHPMG